MRPNPTPREFLDEMRDILASQIKVDIAQAIRQHPTLSGAEAVAAYNDMTDATKIDGLVRDLAYEEAQAAVARGEAPPAALFRLAGFTPNPIGDC